MVWRASRFGFNYDFCANPCDIVTRFYPHKEYFLGNNGAVLVSGRYQNPAVTATQTSRNNIPCGGIPDSIPSFVPGIRNKRRHPEVGV